MQKTIKIEAINHQDKISKNNKPYVSCGIKTKDKNGSEIWLNGFGNSQTKTWKVGDEVEIEVYSEEYKGKSYWKFKTPKATDVLENRIEALEKDVQFLKSIVMGKEQTKQTPTVATVEQKEITVDEIPF